MTLFALTNFGASCFSIEQTYSTMFKVLTGYSFLLDKVREMCWFCRTYFMSDLALDRRVRNYWGRCRQFSLGTCTRNFIFSVWYLCSYVRNVWYLCMYAMSKISVFTTCRTSIRVFRLCRLRITGERLNDNSCSTGVLFGVYISLPGQPDLDFLATDI